MIRLKTVEAGDRTLLWNVHQKYLYEMTNYYDDAMDGEGNYPYGHFDEYFSDPRRLAYFIYDDDTLIGFAMLCPYSVLGTGRDPDHTMAEFTIFPAFRNRRFALDAAHRILSEHPGRWEIKYNEKNAAAKRLWSKAAAPYGPETVHLNGEETVLVFQTGGPPENKTGIVKGTP